MRANLTVLLIVVTSQVAFAGEREVWIKELGIFLRVPAHFEYRYEHNRFHTFMGPQGTIKAYLSAKTNSSPNDALLAAIARSRSGRHPRSYHYITQTPVMSASGFSGVCGKFGLLSLDGKVVPFVDKYFLPIPGGGVCCVSVVSRLDSRRAYLGQMVLQSFRH